MIFRTATVADIAGMQVVRRAVQENALSHPGVVTDDSYVPYLLQRGRGWVCEADNTIAGFAIADLEDNNIWALFVLPLYEGRGIGRQLHRLMLDWYFAQGRQAAWLSTAPGTRAEAFYRRAGWRHTGPYGRGELKLELTRDEWLLRQDATGK